MLLIHLYETKTNEWSSSNIKFSVVSLSRQNDNARARSHVIRTVVRNEGNEILGARWPKPAGYL